MRETRRLVVAISLSGSAVSFSFTGTQKAEKAGKIPNSDHCKHTTTISKATVWIILPLSQLCPLVSKLWTGELHWWTCGEVWNYSALWSDLGSGCPSSSASAGGAGTSAASPSKQTRSRSERRGEAGSAGTKPKPHSWLSWVPQECWHFYAHFSNFGRPCDRNVVGYGRGEADKRGDVEGSAWPLLLQAILCWRYVTLQEQMLVQHSPIQVWMLKVREFRDVQAEERVSHWPWYKDRLGNCPLEGNLSLISKICKTELELSS